jgi:lysozyme
MTPNLSAFLAMIRFAEGTSTYPDPYAVTFGGKFTITDFSNHPYCALQWHGEPLDFLGSDYVGKISTAAGAYQITAPTWRVLRRLWSLPDFSPASQDAATVELIRAKRGALDCIEYGNPEAAIFACSGIWASFPGSTSRQPQRELTSLIESYTNGGGTLA